MDFIINAILGIRDYLLELSTKIDSIQFQEILILKYCGYARYVLGDTVWTLIMLSIYISIFFLLIALIKSIVEFVRLLIPFI
ncbi:MAG: hypothetical protein MI748_20170 [Opitutales bacterium]|nr:hypothetical protein [Opitutales bacterium]